MPPSWEQRKADGFSPTFHFSPTTASQIAGTFKNRVEKSEKMDEYKFEPRSKTIPQVLCLTNRPGCCSGSNGNQRGRRGVFNFYGTFESLAAGPQCTSNPNKIDSEQIEKIIWKSKEVVSKLNFQVTIAYFPLNIGNVVRRGKMPKLW